MYEIVGFRKTSYHIEDQVYTGWTVHFVVPIVSLEPEIEQGYETFRFFVNEKKFPDFEPKLHDAYDLFFNYYNGKQKLAGMNKK